MLRFLVFPSANVDRRTQVRVSGNPDALREVEDAVRVDLLLHESEASQVRPVVRALPAGNVRIDVVLIREAGDVGPHPVVEAAAPAEARAGARGAPLRPVR